MTVNLPPGRRDGGIRPPETRLAAGGRSPAGSFKVSIGLVVGIMAAAGLAEAVHREILLPRGTLEQQWFKGLLGAWAVVLLAGVGYYSRWLYEVFSSVRTSVTILALFALSCVAGSFVLQQRDLDTRGLTGEKAYEAFRLAEAGFVYHMLYGSKVELPMRENAKEFFNLLGERFGPEFKKERVDIFNKMMGGRYVDQEVKGFAERHDDKFRALYDFCQATALINCHRSWWFVALMTMLAISLACGTAKRFVWRGDQIGFYATHLGFLVLMVGFTLSMVGEQRGMLPLEVGKTLGQVWEFNSQKPLDLGFKVTLQDFYTEFHHEIFVEFGDVDHEGKGFPGPIQRGLKPYVGYEYPLWKDAATGKPKYLVKVLDVAEYGTSRPRVVSRPGGGRLPAARVEVDAPDGMGASGWLFAGQGAQSLYQDPEGKFVLAFSWDDPGVTRAPVAGTYGTLEIAAPGEAPQVVEVREGARFTAAGKTFTVAQVAPDFARRDRPAAEHEARNPAVRLSIGDPAGGAAPVDRWTFAWLDFDSMHAPAVPEVKIRFRFDGAGRDPTRLFRLHGKTGGGLELVRFDAAGNPATEPVTAGKPVVLDPTAKLNLVVGELIEGAMLEHPVEPLFEAELRKLDRAVPPGGKLPAGHPTVGAGAGEGHGPGDGHDHGNTGLPPGHGPGDGHDHGSAGLPPGHAPGDGHDHGPDDGHGHGPDDGHGHGPGDGHGHGRGAAPATDWDRILGPVPPDLMRKFHPPGPPAAKLRIEHPGGVEERWFLAGHPESASFSDGVLRLTWGANSNKVKEWRSLLVVTDGETVRRQMVRVNHTLEFKGWTLYQTDADLERPEYSGIQVLHDPGWYLIEPGLILVCLGVYFMFWVKPWLKQDQAGGMSARAGGAA